MKTGDKKIAAILAVVALGAVVFLAVTLTSASKKSLAGAMSRLAESRKDAEASALLPTSLTGNPFSRTGTVSGKAAKLAPGKAPKARSESLGPKNPFSSDPVHPLPGAIPDAASGSGAPPHDLPVSHKLTLSGVLDVNRPTALFALDDGEPSERCAGDVVAPGVTLVRIDKDSVVLSVHGKRRTLATGEETTL